MKALQNILQVEGVRERVIKDSIVVLEEEVAKKKGPLGFATRQGFGVVKKIDSGKMLEKVVDSLLDEFIDSLEPWYAAWMSEPVSRPPLPDYLAARDADVAQSMLAITDRRREYTTKAIIAKSYDALRPTALRNVKDSVPALGRLIEKHTKQPAF